jgi:hypothetical protein
MAGLVPAMNAMITGKRTKKDVDARHEAGHDEREICGLGLANSPRTNP